MLIYTYNGTYYVNDLIFKPWRSFMFICYSNRIEISHIQGIWIEFYEIFEDYCYPYSNIHKAITWMNKRLDEYNLYKQLYSNIIEEIKYIGKGETPYIIINIDDID